MHHPEISGIVNILDDYFLVSDPKSYSRIKSRSVNDGNEDSIVISRQLKNGWIEVVIWGENEDNNDVTVCYHLNNRDSKLDRSIDIECCDFSLSDVRKAVREMFLFDSEADKLNGKQANRCAWTEE
jgi:hypothetical protein